SDSSKSPSTFLMESTLIVRAVPSPWPDDAQSERVGSRRYDGRMTLPSLSISSQSISDIRADALVIGVVKTDEGPLVLGDVTGLDLPLKAIGFAGAHDEFRWMPASSGAAGSIALIGLGS